VDVLAVLPNGGSLAVVGLYPLYPQFRRLGDGGALAWRGVDALSDGNLCAVVIGVGILLALECADMTIAGLVAVIDNPGGFVFAAAGFPSALTNRHAALPYIAVEAMSHYVAKYPLVNGYKLLWDSCAGWRHILYVRALFSVRSH